MLFRVQLANPIVVTDSHQNEHHLNKISQKASNLTTLGSKFFLQYTQQMSVTTTIKCEIKSKYNVR